MGGLRWIWLRRVLRKKSSGWGRVEELDRACRLRGECVFLSFFFQWSFVSFWRASLRSDTGQGDVGEKPLLDADTEQIYKRDRQRLIHGKEKVGCSLWESSYYASREAKRLNVRSTDLHRQRSVGGRSPAPGHVGCISGNGGFPCWWFWPESHRLHQPKRLRRAIVPPGPRQIYPRRMDHF